MKKVNQLSKGQKKIMWEQLESQVKRGYQKYFTDEENRNYRYLKHNR